MPGRAALVVEPSLTVAKVVELTLEHDEVILSASTAQARETFARRHHQIALVAASLPDGDAYELARSFITDAFHPCPVILLRGAFEAIDEARARAAGSSGAGASPYMTS